MYNRIEGGDISDVSIENLSRKGKLKRKKRTKQAKRHSIIEFAACSINKRPNDINTRLVAGHWEGDTIYSNKDGSKECLLTLIERKTRFEIILKIKDRTATSVKKAIDKLETALFRKIFKSITLDNGVEFSDVLNLENSHINKSQRTTLYFAYPYCSSERGSNENHNDIIRRFLPKGTNFAKISHKKIKQTQDWMNNYPRKILNGFTPFKVFKEKFKLQHRIRSFYGYSLTPSTSRIAESFLLISDTLN